jgi:hypothetical protein
MLAKLNDTSAPAQKECGKGDALDRAKRFVAAPYDCTAPSHEELTAALRVLQVRDSVGAPSGGGRPGAPIMTADPRSASSVGDVVGNLAGLPIQTSIIVGATDFFVERAKDELALAYLQTLRDRLAALPIVDSMFPSLAATIRRVDVMTPRTIVPLMRAAAVQDFNGLPERATNWDAYPPAYRSLDTRHQTLMQAAHVALTLHRDVREGTPIAVASSSLSSLTPERLNNDEVRMAVRVLGTVANEYVLSEGRLATLLDKPNRVSFTIAFLANDLAAAPGMTSSLPSAADSVKQKALREFMQWHERDVVLMIERLHRAQQQVKQMQAMRPESLKVDMRLKAAQLATDVLRGVLPLAPVGNQTAASLEVLRSAISLANDAQQMLAARDYPALFAALVPLISPAVPDTSTADAKTLARMRANAFRVMALATSLASAEGPEGVKQALEAAAEPVGSYRAKRVIDADQNPVSFTLNGYVGIGGGAEWSTGRLERGRPAAQFGASIPVGVEITLGGRGANTYKHTLDPRRWFNGIRSWGAFIPLLDLGNVANFRLRSDSLADTPEVGFAQVFAPGIYLMGGLGTSKPFSVGIGAQYAPSLRKSLDSDATSSVVRTSLIFGLDIPVHRF